MIELRMFCYKFAYTIMSDILYKKNQNKSFIQRKVSPLIINLKRKLQKPFHFCLRCQTRHIRLAHLLVEIPRGFELQRNWSIQLR